MTSVTPIPNDPRMTGFRELQEAISELEEAQSGKVLRGSAMSSTLGVKEQAEQMIPVGTRKHKTYRGNKVQPGFAKSEGIKRKSKLVKWQGGEMAIVWIAPTKEAYYTTQWLDPGMRPTTYERKGKRFRGKKVVNRVRGNTEHQHWLRNALQYKQDDVITLFSEEAVKRMDKIAAKSDAATKNKRPRFFR